MKAIAINKAAARPILALVPQLASYRGRKFKIEASERVQISNVNWDGGSRSYWFAVNTVTGHASPLSVQANHVAPWRHNLECAEIDLPQGAVIIEHSIFCGHDMGLRFYVNPLDMPKYLVGGDQ